MNDIKANPNPQPSIAHDFDCTHNPCRCRETDMNDIDIEEGRRLAEWATPGEWQDRDGEVIDHWGSLVGACTNEDSCLIVWLRNNAAAMFDAIETGRQRVGELEQENDELHEDLVRVMEERNTIDWLARKMATAIGWQTEGDNWIERAAAKADAIETGRQWETIARRLAHDLAQYSYDPNWPERQLKSLAAFRDVADRTPTPTDGA